MARLEFVVPAYNAETTILDTLRSLRLQTMREWRAIVVDDGSTDATAAAAASLGDARIEVVRQENRGLAGARNAGFERCRADAVCFLDADDTVDSEFAGVMLAALEGHDLAACTFRYAGPRLEDLGWTMSPGNQDLTRDRLVEFNPLAVGGVVLRRDALSRACGGTSLPFDTRLPMHEDWDLWLRLRAAGAGFAPIVQRPMFAYRLRKGAMTADVEGMWRTGLGVIANAPAEGSVRERAARRWTIRHAARAAAQGRGDLARRWLVRLLPLDDSDVALLGESLRWALGHAHRVSPDRVDPATAAAWIECARHALKGVVEWERLATCLTFDSARWERVTAGLRAVAAGYERVVIVGMGRNGRALLAALSGSSPPLLPCSLAWIDEREEATAPGLEGRDIPRIGFASLGPRDVAVITPQTTGGLRAKCRGAGLALHVDEVMAASSVGAVRAG
ncbi:MAG: glycosyltransferase family 2 protein [Phycisphaerae bacterium]|nr:glycosyltransferase family 2 protein [Phycisphaerae bacterium]